MKIEFTHQQSAHCENGVVSNLMRYNGFDISEPMVFGIGSGLLFVNLPFLKVNHGPAISYRGIPGSIFNRFAKRTGIKIKREKFRDPLKAKVRLDESLDRNIPVGLQVGVFNLPYFPDEFRFHFNAHNLVVYGRDGDDYLVSDPVMEHVTRLSSRDLNKVRFAKGVYAPRGHLYYPVEFPEKLVLEKAIVKGIRQTCKDMLAPIPIIGIRGIRYTAKSVRKWPEKKGIKTANHYLGQIVRMQEEIGTGGGGFRFIYGAFLQEAADMLNMPELKTLSGEITEIGDAWRDFAIDASRIYKNRNVKDNAYNDIADQMEMIADREERFFKKLRKTIA